MLREIHREVKVTRDKELWKTAISGHVTAYRVVLDFCKIAHKVLDYIELEMYNCSIKRSDFYGSSGRNPRSAKT